MARDLRHILDAILAGVLVIDTEGRVEQLNAAACRILGLSGTSLAGAAVESLLGPDHALAQLGRKVLASGSSASQGNQTLRRQDQALRSGDQALRFGDQALRFGDQALRSGEREAPQIVDISASPLFDAAGKVDGVVLVLRDRTLQRQLEELEAERERQASFGRIAAGLAHEVKNPLGGIRGAAELLARRAGDAKTRETAELVVRESERIATLVDDFMVLARSEALEPRPTNLHQVLERVLDLLALDPVSTGIKVLRRFDPSLPALLVDPDRLSQVFLNLARNALQAMSGSGGTLTIHTGVTLGHRLATEPGRSLPAVRVCFVDEGCGMPEEVLRQARTPFFTTRAGGTGLGLAVAEYWTSRHGGSLHIESEPGRGSRVELRLPLRSAE